MPAADRDLNVDRLVTTLYEIQVSAAMLAAQLARDPGVEWSDRALLNIVSLHRLLQHHHPSLERH